MLKFIIGLSEISKRGKDLKNGVGGSHMAHREKVFPAKGKQGKKPRRENMHRVEGEEKGKGDQE